MNLKTSANFYRLFALVVLFTLVTAFFAHGAEKHGVAPDFTLKSNSGENIRLQEQQGNVVLINFWASWCAPCREEFPHFEALQQQYQDLGLDKDPKKANELLDEFSVSFPVLFDDNNRVSELYNVKAMPTTVIVDRDGNNRLTHYGYRTGDEAKYKKIVRALLRE